MNLNLADLKKRIAKLLRNNRLLVFFTGTLLAIFFPYKVFHGRGLFGFILNTEKYNELGDFIGGITTPILSFLGIVYLYKTYRSQKKELRATKRALQAQQASTSLFSMISVLENIIASLRGNYSKTDEQGYSRKVDLVGREVIAHHYAILKPHIRKTQPTQQYYYNQSTDNFDEYTVKSEEVDNLEAMFGSV